MRSCSWWSGRPEDGFIRAEHRELLLVDSDAVRLLDRLQDFSFLMCPSGSDKQKDENLT